MRHLNDSNYSLNFLKLIHEKLYTKYSDENIYQLNIANNILSNNKSLVVAKFKDFLLYEDSSEFLKRFYRLKEIGPRLKKLYKYFHKYILLQPNFCLLSESKYLISNNIKKQLIINKERKHKHKQKLVMNKDKESKLTLESDNYFFNNTLYNEILNQSESFMNTLFGIQNKNKNNDDFVEEDNKNDIEDVFKLIKLIENSEFKLNKGIKLNNKEINDKKNIRKQLNATESTYNINNKNIEKMNNYFNSTYFITTTEIYSLNNINTKMPNILNKNKTLRKLKELKKGIPSSIRVQQKTNKSKDINVKDKGKNTEDNCVEKKIQKVIYHRKMKSSQIEEYLNTIDLPSNSNVVNSLKKANEAYASNQKNNHIKISLYKKARFHPRNNNNSKEIQEVDKNKYPNNYNSNNMTRENTNISNIYGTPMKKEITFSKIEKPHHKIFVNKNNGNSLIYIRNHISSGLLMNSSKKRLFKNNSKSDIKNKLKLTSLPLQNSEVNINNNYNNSSIKEVYLKPKALYKNKANGISGKKLFTNLKA